MSGRHGKMSGCPFHVVTIRDLARESHDDSYKSLQPECNYQRDGICYLPQNKRDYRRSCAYFRCNYLNPTQKRTREDCVYVINKTCVLSKNLQNCSKKEDLAFCCDYYVSKQDNPDFAEKVLQSYMYDEQLATYQSLLRSKHDKERVLLRNIDYQRRDAVETKLQGICNKINHLKHALLSSPVKRQKANEYLSQKISTQCGLSNKEIDFLRSRNVLCYREFLGLSSETLLTMVNKKGKSYAKHFAEVQNSIRLSMLL